jgi:Domain of unknown function DUF11/HYR domain/Secretion system C-terminal sorting domain
MTMTRILTTCLLLTIQVATFGQFTPPTLVKDIRVGSLGSSPDVLSELGRYAYFTADVAGDGVRTLWKTDGTEAGTVSIPLNLNGKLPNYLAVLQNKLYFLIQKSDSINPRLGALELYALDTIGNIQFVDVLVNEGVSETTMFMLNNQLFASATIITPTERSTKVYSISGASGGTRLLTTSFLANANEDYYENLFFTNDALYIVKNGNSLINNQRMVSIERVSAGVRAILWSASSPLANATATVNGVGVLNDDFYYTIDSLGQSALCKISVTSNITRLRGDIIVSSKGVTDAQQIVFQAFGNSIWRTDGTERGTLKVSEFGGNLASINNSIYLTAVTPVQPTLHPYQILANGTLSSIGNLNSGEGFVRFLPIRNRPFALTMSSTPRNPVKTLYRMNTNRWEVAGNGTGFANAYAMLDTFLLFAANADQFGAADLFGEELYKIGLNLNPPPPPVLKADLELKMAVDRTELAAFQHVTFKITLRNAGGSLADSIKIKAPLYDGQLIATGQELASKGDYNFVNQVWNVGQLAAGESATLQIRTYALSATPFRRFAQVIAQKGADFDSQPNNNRTGIPVEDDEAVTQLPLNSQISPCANDMMTPVFANCPTDITISTTASCAIANWTPPVATDNCGTPTVTSSHTSGNCFPVGTTTVTYIARDSAGNQAACRFRIIVENHSTTTDNDLGLAITANPTVFTRYSTIDFQITVRNNGSTPLANAQIEFPFPTGTVNGGSVAASTGVWREWCAGGINCRSWFINRLDVGQTATLTVPLFVLNVETPIVATTRLVTVTPADTVVGNNQATITLLPEINPIIADGRKADLQLVNVILGSVYPNPTQDLLILELNSLIDNELPISFFNMQGKKVLQLEQRLTKGFNVLTLHIEGLQTGAYMMQVPQTSDKKGMIPIVKQ